MTREVQLPRLTSLRFFAAFWVLAFHAIPRDGSLRFTDAFWSVGWIGVTFFFVLSGFILTYTYGQRGGAIDSRSFWVARFARVYPLYLFAMLFAVPRLVRDVLVSRAGASPIDSHTLVGAVVSSLSMTQAWFGQYVCVWNCPSWSVSDEAFFYALFPLVVPLTARPRGRLLILAAAVSGMGIAAWGQLSASAPALVAAAGASSLNPIMRLPEFLVGVWLGGVYVARDRPFKLARVLAAIASVAIVALATWSGLHPDFGASYVESVPLFALLILAVASTPGPERGVLAARPLVLLGEASYALYMLHGPLHGYVLAAFNRIAPAASAWTVFGVYTIASLALAIASYHWLERPARSWIRARFGGAPVGKVVTPR
jgi:peptidoglycan/LPS O-acetylase OafA/YrhL